MLLFKMERGQNFTRITVPPNPLVDTGFFTRGIKFKKFSPMPPILHNVTQDTLSEMIEFNVNTGICESRALGTFSMI